jgi:catechol 2,3-dioxygenase-like lactoylglutathione lyase family enzyme
VSEHTPAIDFENLPAPSEGFLVVDHEPGNSVSSFMNLRVADIQACYDLWSSRGAEFVTPPIDRGAETRCYMRDPDGYLIEVGQSTGLLHGKLAKKRPEDLPG